MTATTSAVGLVDFFSVLSLLFSFFFRKSLVRPNNTKKIEKMMMMMMMNKWIIRHKHIQWSRQNDEKFAHQTSLFQISIHRRHINDRKEIRNLPSPSSNIIHLTKWWKNPYKQLDFLDFFSFSLYNNDFVDMMMMIWHSSIRLELNILKKISFIKETKKQSHGSQIHI